MAIDPDMTHRSNALFSAIVATVAANKGVNLTVMEIARRLGAAVDTTAACIALHRHFQSEAGRGEREDGAVLALPLAAGFAVPAAEDMIDETALGLKFGGALDQVVISGLAKPE
jgi:hypothetical protein